MSLIIRDMSFSYKRGATILDSVSMEAPAGTLTALVGQNGSGKSTILKCINGILKVDGGTVSFNNRNILAMSLQEKARHMSYVPQSIPGTMNFRVFDVVLMGRKPFMRWGISPADRKIVFETLMLVGLGEQCFRYYDELSGGQKQKVLIARALVQKPSLLIMDEPTSNLDLKHQMDVLILLKKIAHEKGISVVLSAHDLNLVMTYADRLVMLKEGTIRHEGSVKDVLTSRNIRDVFAVDAHVDYYKGIPFVLVEKNTTPVET